MYKISLFRDKKNATKPSGYERTEIGLFTNYGMVVFSDDYDQAVEIMNKEVAHLNKTATSWSTHSENILEDEFVSVNVVTFNVNDGKMVSNWIEQSSLFYVI